MLTTAPGGAQCKGNHRICSIWLATAPAAAAAAAAIACLSVRMVELVVAVPVLQLLRPVEAACQYGVGAYEYKTKPWLQAFNAIEYML